MLKEVKWNPDIDKYVYSQWYIEQSGDEEELDDLPPMECDEKRITIISLSKDYKREGKGSKILTSKNLLTKITILCQYK